MSEVPSGFEPLKIGGEFLRRNGPLYVRAEGGDVRLGFRVEARHTNPVGICHGGMMASFCDMLLPVVVLRTRRDLGLRFLPTVSLQVDYLAPAPEGSWVEGRAELLRATRSLLFMQGTVNADGEPAARVSGILKLGQAMPELGEIAG